MQSERAAAIQGSALVIFLAFFFLSQPATAWSFAENDSLLCLANLTPGSDEIFSLQEAEYAAWREDTNLSESGYHLIPVPYCSPDERIDLWVSRLLPDGTHISSAWISEISDPVPEDEELEARVLRYLDDSEPYEDPALQREIEETMTGPCSLQLARQTTVRRFQGVGEVAVTTTCYQNTHESVQHSDFIYMGSRVRMTPGIESSENSGFQNRRLNLWHNFTPSSGEIQPLYRIYDDGNRPGTSPMWVLEPPGPIGRSYHWYDPAIIFCDSWVRYHHPDPEVVLWEVTFGPWSEYAKQTWNLTAITDAHFNQPVARDGTWHTFAEVGTDCEGGWVRSPLIFSQEEPANPASSGHRFLIRWYGPDEETENHA